ncbi:MAG TPA: 30S ribosomal protein S8 [Acidobacteriota bacterium]|nr:30S ribosomal protein S8 [Acidobacteriota bacterium]HMZ79843.1 30S ribosomal protein S8 [Acidobacteriota bacterium]HNB69865.1 30S ribosomal protein S8 [Acidobacteriota bacterium]HNC43279.1 30S ribosomal protein S8 [Acidobacteriota bacterium]HND19211.1 30S ribosomal protein S8 [Acidobacteriota bacterium]
MTDPIADMLTRLRNALSARHQKVDVPASKMKLEIARILKEEGYINNYKVAGESPKRMIRLYLRYGPKGEPVINVLQRVSRPGCRRYISSTEIPNVLGGLGINIVSTSHGIMTGKQARKSKVGGELVCQIY